MAEPAAATPVVDAEYLKEIDKARRQLRALIYGRQCAPIMFRLAFHDAGTYDARTRTGGPNGSIRHWNELSRGANSGINVAVDFCGQPVCQKLLTLLLGNHDFGTGLCFFIF
ncbi:L-ascorbate peroxidase 3 [Linum grandiflorum]